MPERDAPLATLLATLVEALVGCPPVLPLPFDAAIVTALVSFLALQRGHPPGVHEEAQKGSGRLISCLTRLETPAFNISP